MPTITCDLCGKKGARIRRVTRAYGKGKTEFLIRGVPVVSCPLCDESHLTAQTLHDIDRIKRNRKALAVSRPVPIAQFRGAA